MRIIFGVLIFMLAENSLATKNMYDDTSTLFYEDFLSSSSKKEKLEILLLRAEEICDAPMTAYLYLTAKYKFEKKRSKAWLTGQFSLAFLVFAPLTMGITAVPGLILGVPSLKYCKSSWKYGQISKLAKKQLKESIPKRSYNAIKKIKIMRDSNLMPSEIHLKNHVRSILEILEEGGIDVVFYKNAGTSNWMKVAEELPWWQSDFCKE